MRSIRNVILGIGVMCALVFGITTASVFASETNGTIIAPDTVAKGTSPGAGDFNFGTVNGDVHVTDTGLTGYAWGENWGWINLDPNQGGVDNDAEGNLSGYAWGTATGWINFAPTNGGVTIDENGVFHGYAWAANAGWISFNCENDSSCGVLDYKVVTDWRPKSVRDDDTGSGGGGSRPPVDGSPVRGCTDSEAINYNSQATVDDGSCTYTVDQPVLGCTDTSATNYNPVATQNDGSCTYPPGVPVLGCTDSRASNYNPQATEDNDSCVYLPDEPPLPEPPIIEEPPTTEIPFIPNISEIVQEIPKSVARFVERTTETLDDIRLVVNTPQIQLVSRIVSTTGLVAVAAVGALTVLFANPLLVGELFLIPARILSLIMSAFGIKKKARPWGTVYDSVTKMPLDPAYVVLSDESGKEIASSITDLDGRYGFFVPKGTYFISASKTNYQFPSNKMAGKSGDEMYGDLYFGEKITIAEDGEVIYRNIPMDQVNFDWNEFAKSKMKVMKFHSQRERVFQLVSLWLFRIGFVVAVVSLFLAPQPYNFIIFLVYMFVLGLRLVTGRKKINGSVVERETGNPLSFAIVSVYSEALHRELMKKVADQYGRYYMLVPKGAYTLKIQRKNPDESYTEVYSQPYDANTGVVNSNIKI